MWSAVASQPTRALHGARDHSSVLSDRGPNPTLTLVAHAQNPQCCLGKGYVTSRRPRHTRPYATSVTMRVTRGHKTSRESPRNVVVSLNARDGTHPNDTGLFFCQPVVFKALEQARLAGDGSLTGGMRWLIDDQRLRAVDIGNRFWCDIDTPQSLAYAERMLLAGLIQTPGSTTVSRWVKRPVSEQPLPSPGKNFSTQIHFPPCIRNS